MRLALAAASSGQTYQGGTGIQLTRTCMRQHAEFQETPLYCESSSMLCRQGKWWRVCGARVGWE